MPSISDLVHQTSTTTGTGNFTLSAVNGKRSFNTAFSTGGTDTFYYYISNQGAAEWEVGTGHMSDATTLVRDTVLSSSNSNAAVSFSAGTKDVTNDYPASVQQTIVTSDRTYYVRTDGSDSNNGLANSSGGAFLTVPKAIDTVAGFVWNGFTPTIQIGAGTFTTAITLKDAVGAAQVIVVGDTATPTNVVISTTSADCFTATGLKTKYSLRGMKMQTATSGLCIRAIGAGSYIGFQSINFGAAGASHIQARAGGYVVAEGNYTISGGAARHYMATASGALIEVIGFTVTVSGTPAFSNAFAFAEELGEVRSAGTTFSGSATGVRYSATYNAVVSSNGGGASYYPGGTAGTTSTGGQYL